MKTEKQLLKELLKRKVTTPMQLPKSLLLSYRQNIATLRREGVDINCKMVWDKRSGKKVGYYSVSNLRIAKQFLKTK